MLDVIQLVAGVHPSFEGIATLDGIWSRPAIRHIARTVMNMTGAERGLVTQDLVDRKITQINLERD